jgi:hypothetical protein
MVYAQMAACLESGLFLFLIEGRPNEYYENAEELEYADSNVLYDYFPIASCCTGMTIMTSCIVILVLT